MFKTKFVISAFLFVSFLLITSVIKNKTRIIEKKILILSKNIHEKKKFLNEVQLEFHYLTSPSAIEEKIKIIGFNNYEPIPYSKIYFNIEDFNNIKNKISNLKNLNEKIQKK